MVTTTVAMAGYAHIPRHPEQPRLARPNGDGFSQHGGAFDNG